MAQSCADDPLYTNRYKGKEVDSSIQQHERYAEGNRVAENELNWMSVLCTNPDGHCVRVVELMDPLVEQLRVEEPMRKYENSVFNVHAEIPLPDESPTSW